MSNFLNENYWTTIPHKEDDLGKYISSITYQSEMTPNEHLNHLLTLRKESENDMKVIFNEVFSKIKNLLADSETNVDDKDKIELVYSNKKLLKMKAWMSPLLNELNEALFFVKIRKTKIRKRVLLRSLSENLEIINETLKSTKEDILYYETHRKIETDSSSSEN
jgi:hypothetical protein